MSSIHERATKNTFKFLLDKIDNRLASWKAKYLSMIGRITLIKFVTISISGYAMQTAELLELFVTPLTNIT